MMRRGESFFSYAFQRTTCVGRDKLILAERLPSFHGFEMRAHEAHMQQSLPTHRQNGANSPTSTEPFASWQAPDSPHTHTIATALSTVLLNSLLFWAHFQTLLELEGEWMILPHWLASLRAAQLRFSAAIQPHLPAPAAFEGPSMARWPWRAMN